MQGFSLVEVMVAAAMIGMTLFGMSGILAGYSKAKTNTNGLAVAQNIVQAELDSILMAQQIENSLVSDTKGRARPIYIENLDLLVSSYFFFNFPDFPANKDHNSQGTLWDDDNTPGRFANAPGVLYDAGGQRLGIALGKANGAALEDMPQVAYIARVQLYGANQDVDDVELYINGPISAANPHGEYLDTTEQPPYLVADTCDSETGESSNFPGLPYRQKIVVVRVYPRQTYLSPTLGAGDVYTFVNPGGGAKRELAHGYAVINGKIRL
ncbi:hypothetical protein D3C86_1037050 [compost metagenome]